MSAIRLIEDYKLEARMVSRAQHDCANKAEHTETNVHWSQLVQYTVSHVINDLYTLSVEQRTTDRIATLVEKRWTNRHYKFQSAEHFISCKQLVIRHLTQYVKQMQLSDNPILLFEKCNAEIASLDVEMSIIFQVALSRISDSKASSLIIQKFIVEDQESLISSFTHMAAVFCWNAFAKLPERIEIYSVISGKKHIHYPRLEEIEASYDYIRLIKSYLSEHEHQQLPLN
ncbi:hypothetical protein GK047_13385 [Paenibacillus sp. SYP-B3998]|uniref:Uncharacterized protein n=1 Tax=Paenibacillus sp. SYP-B3998 TaxID=2678564 RepID=A0A6G3ZY74_9BACL|nr:hypothetical protein [Paenibacillus sp. SYP-B3998]NEW06998.1 hypothetical protein [Paenibacillus sp. SYP-B3998]